MLNKLGAISSVTKSLKIGAIVFVLSSMLSNPAFAKFPHTLKAKRDVASSSAALPSADSEVRVIKSFYNVYLNLNHDKLVPASISNQGTKLFSKVFRDLVSLNADLCARKSPGEVCGWSADGDPYLSSQDNGPGLNAANSGLTVAEIPTTVADHKLIVVKFTVDPTDKDNANKSQREMRFLIGLEHGKWVVDDLSSIETDVQGQAHEFSSVVGMRSEINTLFDL